MNQCGDGEGTHHFACDCREERFRKALEAADRISAMIIERGLPGWTEREIKQAAAAVVKYRKLREESK